MESITVYYEKCPFCETKMKGSIESHMWAFHPEKTKALREAEALAAQVAAPDQGEVWDAATPVGGRKKRKGT